MYSPFLSKSLVEIVFTFYFFCLQHFPSSTVTFLTDMVKDWHGSLFQPETEAHAAIPFVDSQSLFVRVKLSLELETEQTRNKPSQTLQR